MMIYLCRHGESTSDVEGKYGGDYDDELTEKGKEQAKALAQKLVGKEIGTIYSSPRKRALTTAQIVSEKTGAKIEVIDNFRERNNYGVLTGMVKTEAKEKLPYDVKELEKGPNHHLKGSEFFNKFQERVIRAFTLVANETPTNFAIITHGGPIRRIMEQILNKKIVEAADCAVIEIKENANSFEIIKTEGITFPENSQTTEQKENQ